MSLPLFLIPVFAKLTSKIPISISGGDQSLHCFNTLLTKKYFLNFRNSDNLSGINQIGIFNDFTVSLEYHRIFTAAAVKMFGYL